MAGINRNSINSGDKAVFPPSKYRARPPTTKGHHPSHTTESTVHTTPKSPVLNQGLQVTRASGEKRFLRPPEQQPPVRRGPKTGRNVPDSGEHRTARPGPTRVCSVARSKRVTADTRSALTAPPKPALPGNPRDSPSTHLHAARPTPAVPQARGR